MRARIGRNFLWWLRVGVKVVVQRVGLENEEEEGPNILHTDL